MEKLDARAERSRQALLRSGMERLNLNPDASLSDIASFAGVGRTTLYRQYKSREKLILAIAVYCLDLLDSATAHIEGEARSAMHAFELLFHKLMPFTAEFQFLMNADQWLVEDPGYQEIHGKHTTELLELVLLARQHGEIDTPLPDSWIVGLFEGLIYVGWEQQRAGLCDIQQAAQFAWLSFCTGVNRS